MLFVVAVVATPKEQFWAFGVLAGLVVLAALIGRVPLLARRPAARDRGAVPAVRRCCCRSSAAIPPSRCSACSCREPGLWAAWNIVAKGTIGVAASIVLASTTSVPHVLQGLERLRVPRQLVAITGFMVRYGDVIGDELRRMRIARESRGASASRIGHARAVATSAGALFVRSYERGERVYLAMASRGYVGTMPVRSAAATRRAGCVCLLWPAGRDVVAAVAWSVTGERAWRSATSRSPTRTGTSRSTASTSSWHAGERVAVLGPNGAGKTTLVLALNGINVASRGTVTVGGPARREGQPGRDPPARRHRVPGSRRPAVHADRPRRRRVRAGEPRPARRRARGARRPRRSTPSAWRHAADRSPHHLSFGERRRVALATVLAMRPDVLVLDEPSSNLDPQARRELAEIVLGLDVTTILVTHDLPYALQLCDRAVVLDGGRIVVDGPTREVLADRDDDGRPPPRAAVRLRSIICVPRPRSAAACAGGDRSLAGARSLASEEGRQRRA